MHTHQADKQTDQLYHNLRSRHGDSDAGANGYRLKSYFLREQELILGEVGDAERIVDLGCGSGLMVKPLTGDAGERLVFGLDFNEIACRDARCNQLAVIRGDIYSLPLADDSVDRIINCQFLNQQPPEKARHFLTEASRVLKPGGRLVMIWRNDRAVIHKVAVLVYRYIDKLTGRPEFPYFDNYIEDLSGFAFGLGLREVRKILTFPLFRWQFSRLDSVPARLFGASCFLVLEKQHGRE